MHLENDPIIPEFMMYRPGLEKSEVEEIGNRLATHSRSTKDRFMLFTDILIEFVGAGEWHNRSPAFLSMLSKACFLRGMYGYNQILARDSRSLNCKGYAAAAYCKQSLDPRWLNNLRNITNQSWQAKDYITFAELSGLLASALMDLGYADHARDVASESIDKVTIATTQDPGIRTMVQSALLRPRIILAFIAGYAESREEALIRLDSAHDTAKLLDHQLALNDIQYYRARALEDMYEHDRAMTLVTSALRKYERMGYIAGVADARNLRGVIHLNMGQLQEARDQFEELLIVQQQLNNQVGLARTLINVGEIDRALDQIDQMETYNRRALEISQEAEYMRGITVATLNLGDVSIRRGDVHEALRLYEEAIEYAKNAGMKQTLALIYFVIGDAYYLLQNLDVALENYELARKVSAEVAHKLYSFNAETSIIVTQWARGQQPNPELIEQTRTIMSPFSDWLDASDSSLMRKVRRIVLEDPGSEIDLCVFYDGEKNFECRVERKELRKECFGNLYWMGSLCPFFRDFMAKLEK
ncbi:MAG: tetratricopeptide repeat protein [Candidatus Thorarchaeota archaeon]|nr:tetratricopeptide repeat protein [Candidatus Thorarchaeota archaeon]